MFARRLDEDQVVTITQPVAGDPRGWPARWESLGSPNQNDGFGVQAELGVPMAVANQSGVVVFVRNAAGGVSSRTQQGEAWQDGWATLGGADVQDGLAACGGRRRQPRAVRVQPAARPALALGATGSPVGS